MGRRIVHGSTLAALVAACANVVASHAAVRLQAAAAPHRFGNAKVGTLRPLTRNSKRVSGFYLSEKASVESVSAYLDGRGHGRGKRQAVRFVVFADDGGKPGILLAATGTRSIHRRMKGHWVTLRLTPALRLDPGSYYLGIHSGAHERS